ncbi:cadherin-like beta sandwich domain-containing protein [Mucilaginibacter xinganensis]|uniref:Gliding motility-associated C-terminal domain-containing protein n=1 Tax=Mucilaginibacter xinganensis TaxID=1234841 RepID=A0A223NY86_9SPHI|nr:cadherin-like beta sandwich domain-containing protein [Mucilaginibacter xinganensis]ASU34786.1 gliding motility-associated C-terminal domain-containing protein [Mucilaginibacter xinganensis]
MSKQLFFFNALNVFFTLLLRNLLLTSAVLLFPGITAEATVFRIPNVARTWNAGAAELFPFPVIFKRTYILPVQILDTSNTANTDTVNVTHDLSADASLTNLTISGGTLSPSFSSILINYTATVTDIKRNHIIYTMGDSITAFDEYQSALSSLLNNVFTIVNLGLGSDITNNMIKRFPEVTNGSGEYVIIMAGVNDIKNGVSSSGVEKNLQTMYNLAHNAGLKVIALTVTPFKGYGKWTSKAQSVEDEVNAWIPGAANVDYVIDTYSVLVDPGSPNQMLPLYDRGDHLHPNLKGETKIAEAIYSKAMFTPNLTSDLNNATIEVTPTTANGAAKVAVNGDGLISGSLSKSLPLNMGENIIKTVVTAQDGLTTMTYNLNVKRTLSCNADLANIVLKSGNLYPSFAAGTTNYTAFASNSTLSLTVMPVTLDSGSKIAINGTRVLSEQGSLSISLVAGPNAISIKVTAPDGISTKTYNLTIIRTLNNPVITFPVLPVKNYGDPDFIIAATSSDTQIPISYTSDNVKVATIIGNNVHITGAGTVNITAAQLVDTNYTVAVGVSRSLTVNKVSRTLTFNEIRTKIYGDEDFDANATASSGEAVIYKDYNPSTINIVNGKIHIVGAGTTSITATLDSNTNYDNIPVQSRTLTVNKHNLNVIADNQIKKYGDDNLPFIISYKGFVNRDDVTTLTSQSIASTAATVVSPIGKYDITPTGAGSNNYTFNYVKGILDIIPATRTLLFSTIENKTYGDADFAAGATASSGEPVIYNDYDRSLINIVNGQVHIIGAGITSITATVAPDSNYTDIPFQNQVLNINKANQTITFKDIPRQLVGTSYGLETIATASSGLPVKFVSSNSDIATLYGSDLKLSHLGKISVTALQDGDFNYKPALSVTVPLEITDADGDEVRIRPMLSPNGDGINDFLEIDGIRSYPDNTVTIISRSGEIIYEAKGYNNSTQAFDGHSGKTGALQIAGTYFYLIKYISNGQIRRKTGFLELRY